MDGRFDQTQMPLVYLPSLWEGDDIGYTHQNANRTKRFQIQCFQEYVLFSLVGFNGNLSLLDIFSIFFQGAYSQSEEC